MSILLTTVLICFLGGNIYIYIRILQTIHSASVAVKILFSIIFWLLAAMLFIVLTTRHSNIPEFIPKMMFTIGCLWFIFIMYMTLIMLAADAIRHFFVPGMRYGILYSFGITTIILLAGHINYLHPKINRIEMPIEKEFANGDTVTVVAVSDIHLGYGTGRKRLSKLVDMINSENPDVILIGGDLIDNSLIPLYNENMDEELKRLKAPMGIYMAPGNHEYISGIDESVRFINRTQIKMLFDSIVTLPNGIQIICRDDARNQMKRMSIDKLTAKCDSLKPIILVDHQPWKISEKDSSGVDIQFSGHTHHGQIWPGNIITDIIYEQSHGYRKWPHSHVYVSSGLSLWGPPFRIGTNCDMGVFKIYSTKSETDTISNNHHKQKRQREEE